MRLSLGAAKPIRRASGADGRARPQRAARDRRVRSPGRKRRAGRAWHASPRRASTRSWRPPTCSRSSASTRSCARPAPTTPASARSTRRRRRRSRSIRSRSCTTASAAARAATCSASCRRRRTSTSPAPSSSSPTATASRSRYEERRPARRRRPPAHRPSAQAARAGLRLLRARALGGAGGRGRPRLPRARAASATRSAGSSAWATRSATGASCATRPSPRASPSSELLDAGLVVPGKQRARLRPLPRPPHVPAGRRARPRARLRRAHAGRRQTQVPQLARDAALPQERGALRPRQGQGERRARRSRLSSSRATPTCSRSCRPGSRNVVASMGTALTEQQLAACARYTRNLYLCFDADAAGLGAMSRALGLAQQARRHACTSCACRRVSIRPTTSFRARPATISTRLPLARRRCYNSRSAPCSPHTTWRSPMNARGPSPCSRRCLAEAASPLERDEEVRYVADELGLSQESMRYLLKGGAAMAGARGAAGGAGRRRRGRGRLGRRCGAPAC